MAVAQNITRRSFARSIAATTVVSVPGPALGDSVLLKDTEEFHRLESAISLLVRGRAENCEDIPGFLDLEMERWQVLARIVKARATTMDGLKAKAGINAHIDGTDLETSFTLMRSLARDLIHFSS